MRIAICGPRKDEVFVRVKSVLNTDVKSPKVAEIINQAAETYKYFDETNAEPVVYHWAWYLDDIGSDEDVRVELLSKKSS